MDFLIVGKIVAPQGIKGELRVLSFSDFPERFTNAGTRWLLSSEDAIPQIVDLQSGYGLKPSLFVIKLAEINDRNQADSVRNYLLAVSKSDLPALAEDEFHVSDLIDCLVIYQPTQKAIGKVSAVLEAGNGSVLEVVGVGVGLLPFVRAFVPVVDISQKIVEVTPPDGLIDHLLTDS